MEMCSVDISAAADRPNCLCRADGREIMACLADESLFRCCGGMDDMFHFVPLKTKGRYK